MRFQSRFRMYRNNVRLAAVFFIHAITGGEVIFVTRDPKVYNTRMLPVAEMHIWERGMSDYARKLAVQETRRRAEQIPLKTVK